MLAIGHPSNGKTTGELINLKVGYFLTGLMCVLLTAFGRRASLSHLVCIEVVLMACTYKARAVCSASGLRARKLAPGCTYISSCDLLGIGETLEMTLGMQISWWIRYLKFNVG